MQRTCHIVGMFALGAEENSSVAISISPVFNSPARIDDRSSWETDTVASLNLILKESTI